MKKTDKQISTIIGKDAICKGTLEAPGSVRIDGTVEGDVTVEGMLVVGPTGKILGDVQASGMIIGGKIRGNLTAKERTELTSSANVEGDISTGILVVDEKAVFQGKCNMKQAQEADKEEKNGEEKETSEDKEEKEDEDSSKDEEKEDTEFRSNDSSSKRKLRKRK